MILRESNDRRYPVSRRFASAVIAAAIGVLCCSCRSTQPASKTPIVPAGNLGRVQLAMATMPLEAYTGHPGDGYTRPGIVPPFMEEAFEGEQPVDESPAVDQTPMPMNNMGPWRPPGIECPWPYDEYIFDGGDNDGQVRVRDDWSLLGLDPEDTVAHYDTLDGRTIVKPTHRVCIYAPPFRRPPGDGRL